MRILDNHVVAFCIECGASLDPRYLTCGLCGYCPPDPTRAQLDRERSGQRDPTPEDQCVICGGPAWEGECLGGCEIGLDSFERTEDL